MNLIDAIGKDFFRFENNQYADEDFKQMSSEELATFKAKINLKITNTIDVMNENRDRETRDWLKKKKYVLSLNQKMIPYINELLRKQFKAERSISDYFMDAAKVILPPHDFEKILNNAGDLRFRKEGSGNV